MKKLLLIGLIAATACDGEDLARTPDEVGRVSPAAPRFEAPPALDPDTTRAPGAIDASPSTKEPVEPDPAGDRTTPPMPLTPLPVSCTPSSWRDTLPARPRATFPGPTLSPNAGVSAAAACATDPTQTTSDDVYRIESLVAHTSGRWYFEMTVLNSSGSGLVEAGVAASPSSGDHLGWVAHESSRGGAGTYGYGTFGFAVDLDAGVLYPYENGAFSFARALSLLPGVGAYRAMGHAFSESGQIRLNFGTEPFAYELPDDYQAWSSCASDPDPAPVAQAPIEVRCENDGPCGDATSFLAGTDADAELIVLGTEYGGGSIFVEVERPGRVALALNSYEAADWTIVAGPDTELVSVTAYGANAQAIDGVAGEHFDYAAYQWPFADGGSDTQGFIAEAETRACLPLAMFAGAREASHFIVR